MRDIGEIIPQGEKNAISRQQLCIITGQEDRKNRRDIENSEYLIINLGFGYFRPMAGEESAVRAYKAKERERVKSINRKFSKIDRFLKRGEVKKEKSMDGQMSVLDFLP